MEHPNRKLPRLRHYDYRENGAYFVTICADHHKQIFSRIVPTNQEGVYCNKLSRYGEIAAKTLIEMEERFPGIRIDKYVIMPNHIHAIIAIERDASLCGPSLSDIVCAYKSITAKKCRQCFPINCVFQKSFHDHIIRGREDYEMIWQYIDTNPLRWREDCYFIVERNNDINNLPSSP